MKPNWDHISYETIEVSIDEKKIVFSDNSGNLSIKDYEPYPRFTDLVSDHRKILIGIHGSYFHLLTETIPVILKEIEESTDPVEFFFTVFDERFQTGLTNIRSLIEYVISQIEKLGHRGAILDLKRSDITPVLMNNFRIYSQPGASLVDIKKVSEFLLNGVDRSGEATKKIYLSRGKTLSNSPVLETVPEADREHLPVLDLQNKYIYANKSRMDDEESIEKYMESLGYEIVYAQDLTSFQDQLELFTKVKTVASITGAGLTSLIFMKPGGCVIEFLTPITTDRLSIHAHYYNLSYEMKQLYLAVPHERVAVDLISTIEATPGLKDYISS